MTLTLHTLAQMDDRLARTRRSTETWEFPFDLGSVQVLRLRAEGTTENEHDEIVVTATADSPDAQWVYLWSSDPEFPFAIADPGRERVFRNLPDDICDLIEAETGLGMEQARA